MKNTVLFCLGLSGAGKSYFIKNYLAAPSCHTLISATTRPMRDGEQDGREYYFRDEKYFDETPLATYLWVNQKIWTPGVPKWIYGVPETEITNNAGKNLIYDVIQPKYARQMIDWFRARKIGRHYAFKTIYFIPPANNFSVAAARANMPGDAQVRRMNTCDMTDFMDADMGIDFIVGRDSHGGTIITDRVQKFIQEMCRTR